MGSHNVWVPAFNGMASRPIDPDPCVKVWLAYQLLGVGGGIAASQRYASQTIDPLTLRLVDGGVLLPIATSATFPLDICLTA